MQNLIQPGTAVRVVEVFPRDGLQTGLHEKSMRVPTTEEKIAIVEALAEVGLPEIEVTGFVHPRVIPQLADAEAVFRGVSKRAGVTYRVLVPNLKGAERALACGAEKMLALIAASDTYQRKNSNMTVEENVAQIAEIARLARGSGAALGVGMAICFVCPYEGLMPEDRIIGLVGRFVDLGIGEVTLADSVGGGDPNHIFRLFHAVLSRWPHLKIAFHTHDLSGLVLANVLAAMQAGVRIFETSICGLGGGIAMPIPVSQMGNLATEDLVYMLTRMGLHTGVQLEPLLALARRIEDQVQQRGVSRLLRALTLDDLLAYGRRFAASS